MPKKNAKKDYGTATLAGVKKEMAQPRVAKSARNTCASFAFSVGFPEASKPSLREAAESRLPGKLLKK
jgi:hypothetical protein